jgi:SAM-dependent methyltransferase
MAVTNTHTVVLPDVAPVIECAFSEELELAYVHVDRMCVELCLRLADELGLLQRDPEPIDRLIARVRAADQAVYVVNAVLDILAEAGFARHTERGWSRVDPWPPDGGVEVRDSAREACPGAAPTFDLIDRCHACAAGFIAGHTPGMAAVFPRGDLGPWARLHKEDRVMSIYADLVAPVLRATASPGMRILEVGGGVGAVLARCASSLASAGVAEYWFTDVGRVFVDAAQSEYGTAPWLRVSTLDIDRPLEDQGLSQGAFDIVIAVNVLHVARDLGFSLRELLGALRSCGTLVLAEGSPPSDHVRWRLDVVFGFLRGWWDVALDGLRPRPGFMMPSAWERALRACGYEAVSLIPGERWFDGPCRGGLVVARAPARPDESDSGPATVR